MILSVLRPAFVTVLGLGCLLPVFALSDITLTDGTTTRGTIISEEPDFIVVRVDGTDTTIPRSTIRNISNDTMQPAASDTVTPESTVSDDTDGIRETPAASTARQPAPPAEEPVPVPMQAPPPAVSIGRATRERLSIGIDAYMYGTSDFTDDKDSDLQTSQSRNSFTLSPYIGIRTSDLFEIRPSLTFGRQSYSRTYDNGSSSSSTLESIDSSSIELGFDVGFIFYPIRGNFFRISLGPTLGYNMWFAPHIERTYSGSSSSPDTEFDRYANVNIMLSVPFSFDFIVSEHLGLRLSSVIYSTGINIRSIKGPDSTTDYTDVGVTSSLDLVKTVTQFGLGIFLLF